MTNSSLLPDPEVARANQAAHVARCKALMREGQRLLARIRPTSKYFGQGKKGQLFPAVIASNDDYGVVGGPGGQYRLRDVDLFVHFSEGVEPIQITFDRPMK